MASSRCQRPLGPNQVPPPGLNTHEPYMTLCGPLNNPGFYTFCSTPKPVQRPKYRNNIPRPRGVHDFYNMMWDPHVYRGSGFVTFDKAEEDRCRQKRAAGTGNNRKKLKRSSRTIGGIQIPSTPPQEGKNTQLIQTERFLEELSATINEIDACTQTDSMHDAPIPEAFIPAKFGLDMYTQIEPGELFDFNKEVCPIVENMVNKILEQALLETMEEEELEALRDQQRAYEELRRQELLRLQRLVDREQKVQNERQILMEKLRDERVSEFATEDRIGSYLFSCNYLRDLVSKSMESLRRDGYLQNRAEMYANLVPWLNKAVTIEVKSVDISRLLLDDILRTVSLQREDEMGKTIFADVDEQPVVGSMTPLQGEGEGEDE